MQFSHALPIPSHLLTGVAANFAVQPVLLSDYKSGDKSRGFEASVPIEIVSLMTTWFRKRM
jgi:hypothetical protein